MLARQIGSGAEADALVHRQIAQNPRYNFQYVVREVEEGVILVVPLFVNQGSQLE